jgi:RsiW-degrading membrane proteinase PrsW (M82 family)
MMTGIVCVAMLYLAHFIINRIDIWSIRNVRRFSESIETILFVIVVHSIISILFVAISNRGFGQLQVILGIWATIVIIAMTGFGLIGLTTTMMYYLFVALSEEYLKSRGAYTWFTKYNITNSDIIIFGLIASLGFACVENIIHLISQITQLWTQHIIANSGLIITKWIASTMMHLFFTSFFAMAYLHYQQSESRSLKIIIWGILAWVCVHRSYDTLLSQWYRPIVIVYTIVGYFWLTYVLYRSDRLYIDHKDIKTVSKT